jgi:hypothetical protein
MSNSKVDEPTGIVRIIGVETRREHPLAVYGTVICEDEAKRRWSFPVASFTSDLTPVPDQSQKESAS